MYKGEVYTDTVQVISFYFQPKGSVCMQVASIVLITAERGIF